MFVLVCINPVPVALWVQDSCRSFSWTSLHSASATTRIPKWPLILMRGRCPKNYIRCQSFPVNLLLGHSNTDDIKRLNNRGGWIILWIFVETSWHVLSHSFFPFFSKFSEEKWRRKFAGSMNNIQTLFITFIKWIFPKADKLILLILMRRITFSRTLLVTSTAWEDGNRKVWYNVSFENQIQNYFWESDMKLNIFSRDLLDFHS